MISTPVLNRGGERGRSAADALCGPVPEAAYRGSVADAGRKRRR